jgi:hypothetical protein
MELFMKHVKWVFVLVVASVLLLNLWPAANEDSEDPGSPEMRELHQSPESFNEQASYVEQISEDGNDIGTANNAPGSFEIEQEINLGEYLDPETYTPESDSAHEINIGEYIDPELDVIQSGNDEDISIGDELDPELYVEEGTQAEEVNIGPIMDVDAEFFISDGDTSEINIGEENHDDDVIPPN